MVVSLWLVMPIPAISSPFMPNVVIASATTDASELQMSFGLCSTQPGFWKCCGNSFCEVAQMWPSWSKMIAREELVPWSRARIYLSVIMLLVYTLYSPVGHPDARLWGVSGMTCQSSFLSLALGIPNWSRYLAMVRLATL